MGTKTRAALTVLGIGLGAAMAARAPAETTVAGTQGPSSSQTAYLVPVAPGVRAVSIMTVGDTVNPKLDGVTPYRMVGLPDGLGAMDAGDGTFLLTMNHEISSGGVTRAHGSNGSFVSVWRIDRTTLQVRSVYDLMRTILTWNAATQTFVQGTSAFSRFCSADMPAVSAFHDAASGLGTTERFHLNGEESSARAVATLVTGTNAGVTTELPRIGKQSWENIVACPFAQTRTVVGCTDDSTPGQVFVYVGTKLAAGTDVQKAGLLNGTLYGVIANGATTESQATGINNLPKGTPGPFTLAALPDQSAAGANLETAANAALVTKFNRPEDCAWDPAHPADLYFVTTDGPLPNGRSRLWRLRFTDITSPAAGGTVTMLLDGTEGGDMYDNIAIDRLGHVLLQEDLGTNAKSGKIWQYDIGTGGLKVVAKHDPARFGDTGTPATSPFNTDEESSGIVDASDLLGPGWFLCDVQAHYGISGGELIEGGQVLALYNPDSVAAPTITAAATATPATPVVGESVSFGVTAAIVGDGALTYAWSFGDGSVGVGRNPSHTYTAAGVWTAVVTVTHVASGKSAASQVQVDVGRPLGNFDVVVQLNWASAGRDSLSLSGELPIPDGYDPASRQVTFDVGGVARTFTMDASGRAALSADESFRLVLDKTGPHGTVPAQHGRFDMLLTNQDLRAAFADEGLTNRTTSDEAAAIALVVTFEGHTDRATHDVLYDSTVNKKATAR